MRAAPVVYGVSLGVHVVIAIVLNAIPTPKEKDIVAVEMQTIEQKEKEKEKPKPPEEAPAPAPKAPPRKAAPPVEAPPEAPPEPAPDFGFAMGSADGPGGIAVGPPAPRPAAEARPVVKKLVAKAAVATDGCTEEQVKPKALSMPHPGYTEEARAAAIEGKVRVELTLDAAGVITGARALEGLGYGLDEAAIAALRGASFAPATRCGVGVPATFVVAVRFAL